MLYNINQNNIANKEFQNHPFLTSLNKQKQNCKYLHESSSNFILTKEDLQILQILFQKVHSNISIRQLAYHIRQYVMSLSQYQESQKENYQSIQLQSQGKTLNSQIISQSKVASLMDSIQYYQTINLDTKPLYPIIQKSVTQTINRPQLNNVYFNQLKNKYLNFYLKCQAKLFNSKSDQQWRSVFNREIMKHQKLLYIGQQFLEQIKFKKCWKKLRGCTKIKISSIFEQRYNKMQNRIQKVQTSISQIGQFDDIVVQEQIKIKTKYFFKWCKFLQQSKQVQRLRMEQLENIQKSIYFNGYTMKQNKFNQWKKVVEDKRLERALIQIIKNKRIQKQKQNLINTLISTKQLKNIQINLQKVINNKITTLKSISFFRYLKFNMNFNQKIQQNTKIFNNIWYFRALKTFTQNLSQVKNKTYCMIRQKFEKQYSIKCLIISLQVFKSNHLKTKKLISQFHSYQRKVNFKSLLQKNRKIKYQNKNIQQFEKILLSKNRVRFVYMLSLNRVRQKNKLEKLQLLNKSIKHSKITKLLEIKQEAKNALQNHFEKQISLQKTVLIQNKISVFKHLSQNKKYMKDQKIKIKSIKNFITSNILEKFINIFNYRKNINQQIQKLEKRQNKNISKYFFNCIKQNNDIIKSQKIFLFKINQKLTLKWIEIIYRSIKHKKNQSQNISKLLLLLDKQLLKKGYKKIFNSYMRIQKYIKDSQLKRQLNLKSNLFNTIKLIGSIKQQKVDLIKDNLLKNIKFRLFKKLTIKRKTENQVEKIKQILLKSTFKKVVCNLKQYKQEKDKQVSDKWKVFGSIFMKRFFTVIKSKRQLITKQNQMKQKLSKMIKQYSINKLVYEIVQVNSIQNVQIHKNEQLINFRIKKCYQRMRKNMNYHKEHNARAMNTKIEKARKIVKKNAFQYLVYPKKIQQVKNMINFNYQKLFFNYLKENHQQIKKIQKLYYKKAGFLLKGAIIYNQTKQNIKHSFNVKQQSLSKLIKNKQKNALIEFLELAKDHKTLCKNTKIVAKKDLQQNFSCLIKGILHERNNTIKNKVSIIHYAKNIKKKVLNSFLINSLRVKHKENKVSETLPKQSKISHLNSTTQNQNLNIAKVEKLLANSRRSDKITDKISRFNMTKSRQVKMI